MTAHVRLSRVAAAVAIKSCHGFDRAHILTAHFHDAPVWIAACLEDGPNPNRAAGSSIYPAVQNMVLAMRPGPRHDADDAPFAL
jgi:hypothetical protein